MHGGESKNEGSIWEVIHKHGSSDDRKLLLALSLFYGLSSLYIIGYPLWFKEPELLCHNKMTNTNFICSEIDACHMGNYTMIRNSSMSLTAEYGLVCEKADIKRKTISFSLFGYIIGMFLNMVLPITALNRKTWIGFCSLGFSIGALLTLIFSNNITLISYGLCNKPIFLLF